MQERSATPRYMELTVGWLLAVLLGGTIGAVFLWAPTEATMFEAQRIVYLHVAVAWVGLLSFLLTAGAGVAYLWRRQMQWDFWAQSAAEVGWLCSTLTLVSGSLWAHAAWNTWWTWDPRLTTSLILWALYGGYFLVRGSIEEPEHRARIGAVLAVLGALDVPLVVMSTRWFRGLHPVTPEMEPAMRGVLIVSVFSFTVFFAYLLGRRYHQLLLAHSIAYPIAEG